MITESMINATMFLGLMMIYIIAASAFIGCCLLTKVARNYYLNAKCEVSLFIEFLQARDSLKKGEHK